MASSTNSNLQQPQSLSPERGDVNANANAKSKGDERGTLTPTPQSPLEGDGGHGNASASTMEVNEKSSTSEDDKKNGDEGKVFYGGHGQGSGRRKRELHRRKSDPGTLKKIPRVRNQDFLSDIHAFPILPPSDLDEEYESMEDDDSPFLISTPRSRRRSRPKRGELVHLRWAEHQSHLLLAFESLLKKESLCDVTLVCDPDSDGIRRTDEDCRVVRMKAHKLLLSAASPYFTKIFEENPCKHPVVVLKDFYAWEMEALLQFIYRGEVSIRSEKVPALVKTAQSLEIRGLMDTLQNLGYDLKEIHHPNLNEKLPIPIPLEYDKGALNLSSQPIGIGMSGDEEEEDLSRRLNRGRKQARPRRRSGDYFAQDLRKVSNSSDIGEDDGDEDLFNTSHPDFDDEEDEEDILLQDQDEDLPIPVTNNLNKILTRRLLTPPGSGSGLVVKDDVLEPRRKSSRLHPHGKHENEKESEEHEILDFSHNSNKHKHRRESPPHHKGEREGGKGPSSGIPDLQQQHLAFLRNYNWAMAQQQQQRNKMSGKHHDADMLEGDEPLTPPPMSFGKGMNAKHPMPPYPFIPGLHPMNPLPPHPHPNGNTTPSPGKASPSFFLPNNGGGSMSITPLERDDRDAYSPLNLNLQHGEGERDGGGSLKERGHGKRGSPLHHHHHGPGTPGSSPSGPWPGLPIGPPPIFGRHRAQHSAPRGGPPRAWSNADLTEALHNVWNKKMTTSQASRIFGIPYNSLLMYVRGKYGKSLKLDLLKKGLDQALENKNRESSPSSSSPPSGSSGGSNANANHPTNTPNPQRGSPLIHNNNNSLKSHPHSLSESNNNNSQQNPHGNGLGGNKGKANGRDHSHHHQTDLPTPQLPPGFNPFLFSPEFAGNPFPFASALQHILPPHLGHGHHPPFPSLLPIPHQLKGEKVGSIDEEK